MYTDTLINVFMKRVARFSLFIFIFLIYALSSYSQLVNVSGSVLDKDTFKPISCRIYINGQDKNIISNKKGFFLFQSASGLLNIEFSHPSYEHTNVQINLQSDTLFSVFLTPIVLEEVIATNTTSKNEVSEGRVSFNLKKIESMPAFMGEPDVFKSITLLPGMAGGQEGTSSLWVRGGTPDQNLLLYDNATVFNPSHLLGLVSVFNPDVISSLDVYKGNFPARFGSRLSSVVDVKSESGFVDEPKAKLSIGLLSSRLSYQKTLVPKKISLFAAARSTYLSLPLLPLRILYHNGGSDNYYNYWMTDFNFGSRWNINKNNSLVLSLYTGLDNLRSLERPEVDKENQFNLKWGNRLISLNHYSNIFGRFEVINTLSYSRYKFNSALSERDLRDKRWQTFYENTSAIHNIKAISNWEILSSNEVNLKAGLESNTHISVQEGGGLVDSINNIKKNSCFMGSGLVC